MAQAARLNLRMQKELKLLLTDPPPAASFPTLSDAGSSLTSIDALLQGPEGTVYSNGVFKIRIQIPERYPFQPPIVTFVTPIYHPNIDNGGRICLDILNLPPKGMWQPSLNISTVLTSIGLLLSEPNPDDGLMHEASRDYKYNRQAFDQHARSMTEKYAQVGVTDIARAENRSQDHTGQNTSQTIMEGSVASEFIPKHKNLSREHPGCSNNRSDSSEEIAKAAIHNITKNHTEIGQMEEASIDSSKCTWNFSKLRGTRYKLSAKVPVASDSRNGESENTRMSNQSSPVLEIQTSSDSPELSVQVVKMVSIRDKGYVENNHSLSVGKELQSLHHIRTEANRDSAEKPQSTPQGTVPCLGLVMPQEGLLLSHNRNYNKTNPPKDDAMARKGSFSTSIKLKKRGPVGSKPSSEPWGHSHNHLMDDKENLPPLKCSVAQLTGPAAASAVISPVIPGSDMCKETKKKALSAATKLSETAVKHPLEPLNQVLGSNNNEILQPTNDNRWSTEVCDGKSVDTFKKQNDDSQATDDVIVLDSEDSDDEKVPARSKLSLGKRCTLRKRKLGLR